MRDRSQLVTWLEARRSAGESPASIARGFGVSTTTVTLWLQGKRNPSRMALVLGGTAGAGARRELAAGIGRWPAEARAQANI